MSNRFTLILANCDRINFTVSEADIDDAIDYGHAERDGSLQKQLRDAAYHKVMELRVDRRALDELWRIEMNGEVIAVKHA